MIYDGFGVWDLGMMTDQIKVDNLLTLDQIRSSSSSNSKTFSVVITYYYYLLV